MRRSVCRQQAEVYLECYAQAQGGDGVRLGQGTLPVDVNGRVENRLGEVIHTPVNDAGGMQVGLRQAALNQVQYILVACEYMV